MEMLFDISSLVIPLLLAITMHEAAHGFVAWKLGDVTAYNQRRVSLNPLRHIDLFGSIIIPATLFLAKSPFLFGYARPVPIDMRNFKNPARDMIMVALAGPGMNLLLAILSAAAFKLHYFLPPDEGVFAGWLYGALYGSLLINLVLMVFNMLPILPLDGGRVLACLLPYKIAAFIYKFENMGILVVLALFFLPEMLGLDWNIPYYLIALPVDILSSWLLRIFGVALVV